MQHEPTSQPVGIPDGGRTNPGRTSPWTPLARGLASVALVAYMAAVIVPPLAGPPPASDLARALIQPLRPLIGLLHLGHGYRFFAPDPGPGHSIRWRLERSDGSTLSGTIPDRDLDWPRLLYHRRFMISEKIAAMVPLPGASEEVRRDAKREWLPLVKGVAGQLLDRHGGGRVELTLVEHYLPDPDELLPPPAGAAARDAADRADLLIPLGIFAPAGSIGP